LPAHIEKPGNRPGDPKSNSVLKHGQSIGSVSSRLSGRRRNEEKALGLGWWSESEVFILRRSGGGLEIRITVEAI